MPFVALKMDTLNEIVNIITADYYVSNPSEGMVFDNHNT